MTATAPPAQPLHHRPLRGRGAVGNVPGRFAAEVRQAEPDSEPEDSIATEVTGMPARSLIRDHDSPDIPLHRSINPYRGCEHGCAYCFARPSHAYLELSPGLDFETRIFYKEDAAQVLERELSAPGYRPEKLGLGFNTDAYQPIERRLRVTRSLLEVLHRFRHPVLVITKSTSVLRDLDLLRPMARARLAEVVVSVTTLDPWLARTLEPRAAAPAARLGLVRTLAQEGIPVRVSLAPVIPFLNDREMERIIAAVAARGACGAGYAVLRLPHELKELFRQWLAAHAPGRAKRIMAAVQALHGGADYNAEFGRRMVGDGDLARMLAQRFRLACRKHGLPRPAAELRTDLFRVPSRQPELFA